MREIHLFGDSAAQGIVLDETGNYRVSRKGCIRLLKHAGYPIRNHAVHGYTIQQGLDSFRKTKTEPGDICVIEFGGNDCDLDWDAVAREPDRFHDGRTPLAGFRVLLKQFVQEARDRKMSPILVTPLPLMSARYYRWVSKNRDAERILAYLRHDPESISRWQERYAIAVRSIAEECGCPLADLRAWMLEELDYPSLICEDGIHPNEAGHTVIAREAMKHFPRANLSGGLEPVTHPLLARNCS
mgnify:CR=1 FL=1